MIAVTHGRTRSDLRPSGVPRSQPPAHKLALRYDVSMDPLRKRFSVHVTGGQLPHQALLLIHWRHELVPIQEQEYFNGGVAGALVAIHEGVIPDE